MKTISKFTGWSLILIGAEIILLRVDQVDGLIYDQNIKILNVDLFTTISRLEINELGKYFISYSL